MTSFLYTTRWCSLSPAKTVGPLVGMFLSPNRVGGGPRTPWMMATFKPTFHNQKVPREEANPQPPLLQSGALRFELPRRNFHSPPTGCRFGGIASAAHANLVRLNRNLD